MFHSLRARLLASHLVVIGLVFILTTTVAVIPLRRAQDRLEISRLENVAGPLALQAGFMLNGPARFRTLLGQLLDFQAGRLDTRMVLLDREGRIVHDTGLVPLDAETIAGIQRAADRLSGAPTAASAPARLPVAPSTEYLGIVRGHRVMLVGVPQSDGYVLALVTPRRIFPLFRELFRPLVLSALVGLLGALVATVFLSRSIARPITRLTAAADAVAAGDLDRRVPGAGEDEVGRLVRSFNGMVSRLQATYESQRNLLAQIAHELRTPLTSIQGYALALRDGVVSSEEERANALDTIADESERVSVLVNQILQLARLESGQATPKPTVVSVQQIIGRIVRRHRIAAESGGIELESDVASPKMVEADEALLEQAIDNLVRNALQHTPRGGRVVISAGRAMDAAAGAPRLRIRVSDTGPGIPPEDIPHIFDRFYRAGTERTAGSARTSGFGLGLAIVKEIAAGHGGSVGVESQPGRGTAFVIDLPLREDVIPGGPEEGTN